MEILRDMILIIEASRKGIDGHYFSAQLYNRYHQQMSASSKIEMSQLEAVSIYGKTTKSRKYWSFTRRLCDNLLIVVGYFIGFEGKILDLKIWIFRIFVIPRFT